MANATKRAIDLGVVNARKYREVEHSRSVSMKMSVEQIDQEIVTIIDELKEVTEGEKLASEEIKLAFAQTATALEE